MFSNKYFNYTKFSLLKIKIKITTSLIKNMNKINNLKKMKNIQ